MKKLIFSAIAVFFSFTFVNAQNDLPNNLAPDMKYWFSQTQFQNSVEFAIKTRRTVRRCFIDGIEFTEQGYIRNLNGPKDSKLVKKICDSDSNEHIIKYVYVHPEDIKNIDKRNQNVQYIKF